MKVGTRSVLFGVHQFLYHPWTVARSWKKLYGQRPNWWEAITIFCHDLGYLGCSDMDGEIGRWHPIKGAELAAKVVHRLHAIECWLRYPIRTALDKPFRMQSWWVGFQLSNAARRLALGHSRYYCERTHTKLSPLFRADKLCVRFDPPWFYLLRATLSGEINEYIRRSPLKHGTTAREWYCWYCQKVEEKFT